MSQSFFSSAFSVHSSDFPSRLALGARARLFAEGGGLRALGLLRDRAEGEAARGEQRDAYGHPEDHARLSHYGERDARRRAEREHARQLSRAQFVNARAQRHELEDDRDDSVDRLEEERREHGRLNVADERYRYVGLDHAEHVEGDLAQEYRQEAALPVLVEAVDSLLERGDLRAPPLERAPSEAPRRSPFERGCQKPPLTLERVGRHHDEEERARDGAVARIAQDLRQVEARQQGRRAAEDEERDREHIEDVLDRDGREAGGERHAVAHERGLRRLAHDNAERHDVARHVAYQVGLEGIQEREPVRPLEAERPRQRAPAEAQARQHQYRDEAPADLRDVRPDFAGAGLPDEVREQREPDRREGHTRGRKTPRRALCFHLLCHHGSLYGLASLSEFGRATKIRQQRPPPQMPAPR